MTRNPERLLRLAIAEFLGDEAETLRSEENLFEAGLDSIGLLRLVNRLRRDRVDVDFAVLAQEPTLSAWIALLGSPEMAEEAEITPAPEDAPAPLGGMQHAYWVGRSPGQRLGGVAAHLYVEFDRDGNNDGAEQPDAAPLDPERLRRAFARLMDRHATLRSKVTADGHQQVLPELPVPFTVHDLRSATAAERDAKLEKLRHDLSHQSLDVESGSVFTAALSLLPEGATRLHLDIDMIAADAVSYRLLMADLVALYRDPEREMPALTLTYRDYLIGMKDRKAAKAHEAEAFWTSRLDTLPGAPVLPERLLTPEASMDSRVARRYMWLSPERKAALLAMARRNGVTPAMTVAAVLAEVIGRWSATKHFLLNVPMFDRPAIHPEIDGIAGDFSSSVMLEVDLRQPRSFVQRVRELQARMHEDAAHSAYGGLDVLRELGRIRGETVLAPVVFTSALGLGELFAPEVIAAVGHPAWVISQGPQVLLDAQVTEFEHGLLLNWDTREEALAPGVADAMFSQFETWLAALISDPGIWQAPLTAAGGEQVSRQIDGQPVRILDAHGLDCPAHVAGHLEPAAAAEDARLCARADENGQVKILGREDICLYLHGVPVWPQDVEAALRTDPRISELAVIKDGDGFAAVVVPVPRAGNLTGMTLRAELARRVPAHLLPARVIVTDYLPRCADGAVDVLDLRKGILAQHGNQEVIAPRNNLERVIADAWADILGLTSIGVNEEFIALGGDSLLATRLVARLQEELDTAAVTLRALFRYPTIAELGAFLLREEDAARLEEIAALILEIRNMSDEEVAELLAAEEAATAEGGSRDVEPVA